MTYVYLMYSRDRRQYKIGVAKDVNERLDQLQTADPSIRVVCAHPAQDAYGLEAELHQRYAYCHRENEWFALGRAQVRQIQQLGDSYWTLYRRLMAASRRFRQWLDYWLTEIVRIAILGFMAAAIFLPSFKASIYPLVFMIGGAAALWTLRE